MHSRLTDITASVDWPMRQQGKFELDVVTYWHVTTHPGRVYLFIYLKGKGHMATTMLKNKKTYSQSVTVKKRKSVDYGRPASTELQ